MKPKTFIAALIALLMLAAPCAALIGAGEAYAEDSGNGQDEGLSVGDAWGISITANSMEELIEKIEELFNSDPDPEVPTGDDAPPEVPAALDSDEESDLTGEFLTLMMKELNVEMKVILSGIIEVTRADPEVTGYTLSMDAGIYLMIKSTIDVELEIMYQNIEDFINDKEEEYVEDPEYAEITEFYEGFRDHLGNGKLFVKGEMAVAALLKGVIKLDTEGDLTSVDLSIDISGKISLETNIDIPATFEHLPSDHPPGLMIFAASEQTEEDTESSFVKYLEPDAENDIYSITLGGSLTYHLYVSEHKLVLFDELISGTSMMTASMYADFEVPAALHNQVSELMVVLIDELDLPEDYEYQFEDKFQLSLMDGFMESFDDLELDDVFLDLDYLEMDKESDMFLSSEDKGKIRKDIKTAESRFKGMVSTFKFDVTFLDEEGEVDEKLSMKVSHGERIKLPILDKNDENEKFVGWRTTLGGLEWNPVWGVKGDLTLEPIYIEVSDDLEAAFTNLRSIGAGDAYITLTIEDLEELTESNFNFQGTLYVDVVDADGNVLYSWSINSSGDKIGKITNFKVESDNTKLNDEVRKHIGNGKSMYLNFSSSGPTPGLTTVKYNVSGVYEDGTELDVYFVHEDEEGNVIDVELVGTAMVSNGMVAFNANHFSGYVLSMSILDSDKADLFLYVIIAVIAIVVIAAIAAVAYSRKKA